MPHHRRPTEKTAAALVSLTRREQEIIRLVALGLSNKDIASLLVLSDRTVQTHLTRLFQKLNVENRAAAVYQAVRRGVISVS